MATIDFKTEVLDRSHEVPVVVDFWASWCGPCRVLGPVIEQLAAEAEGRWELVKLDTEEQPDIARDYGIMSIPAVKMFRGGQVVSEFVGALPSEMIRRWLESSLPDARTVELESILGRATHPFDASIVEELAAFVRDHPEDPLARLRLALSVVPDDPARARELAGAAPEQTELAEDVISLADLMKPERQGPERIVRLLDEAREAFGRRDLDATLEHLVDAAMIDKRFDGELSRRAAVALFHALGQDHELTRQYRRRLAMALHT